MKSGRTLKGTWPQALLSFFGPIAAILVIRWALFEPYVIPSGSMIPNLLIHDHVFVSKSAFGVRLPFSDRWLARWADPQPGDIIVFRYPENPAVFYIKRLIAGPGSKVKIDGGRVTVDGKAWTLETRAPRPDDDPDFEYFTEFAGGRRPHTVRFLRDRDPGAPREWTVPEREYFFMGDNRDQSSDGRVWGFVPEKNLIGKAALIWLSCDEMLESAKFVCDPTTIRWSRLFKSVISP